MKRDWKDQAACAREDPELFFPNSNHEAVEARAICGGCPVRFDCLEEAMRYEANADRTHRSGIWGGLGTHQRAALAKKRRQVAS